MDSGAIPDNEEEERKPPQNNFAMQVFSHEFSQNTFPDSSSGFGVFPATFYSCGDLPFALTSGGLTIKSQEHPSVCREQDILLGRGAQYAQNPGNRRFYQAIDECTSLYDAAQTKHEKSGVVLGIFQLLSSERSRFLKKNAEDGTFTQIEDKDARQKISHALRYRKQNKSNPSSRSTVPKKAYSGFPNTALMQNANGTAPLSPNSARSSTTKTPDQSIFSDEELDSVVPSDNSLPSSFASFQFYAAQDDKLGSNGGAKEGGSFSS